MHTPHVYLNGQFVPFSAAGLPLHDAGFVSGATVVDNARTFRQQLFRWPDHLARFRRDCQFCYVPLEATDEHLTAAAAELVSLNARLLPAGGELQLVTFATPGPLGFYLGEKGNGPPTLGMVTYPLPFARYRPFFTSGVTLALLQGGGTGTLLPATVKHRSRMFWHIADHKAREQCAAALALPLGPGDVLTETSIGNVLLVCDGVLLSPPRETILDGISLRVTRELCGQLGLAVHERPLTTVDLANASEVLLTGTGFGIAGVREGIAQDGVRQRLTWPGPTYRRLLDAWSALVDVDIERQFTGA